MSTKSDDLCVFTHSKLHRAASFFIVGMAIFFYMKQFKLVSHFYTSYFSLEEAAAHPAAYVLAIKLSLALGLLAGFIVVCLTIYTLIDVWGLKVMVTGCSVIVMNTLIPFPGTGEVPCEEIVELRKGIFRFYLVGEKNVVRFSGVDRIERLFFLITECKRMNQRKSTHDNDFQWEKK